MKILALTFLMSLSMVSFADDCKDGVGQGCSKSPEVCEDVDKCPSQTCANSCLNKNNAEGRKDISKNPAKSGEKNSSATQQ